MVWKSLNDVLRKSRHLRNEDEIAEFDFALAELPEQSEDNVAYLTKLFDVFVDDCDQPEVMWGLLHFVESFDDETYISSLLLSIDDLLSKAEDWLEIILARVLNNDDSRNQLILALKSRPKTENKTVIELLEKFKTDEEPELRDSASEVLHKLE